MRLLLLAAAMVLVCAGIITIYTIGNPHEEIPVQDGTDTADSVDSPQELTASDSMTQAAKPNQHSGKWQKQLAFAGAGLLCLVLVNLFHYRQLGPISYALYAFIGWIFLDSVAANFVKL